MPGPLVAPDHDKGNGQFSGKFRFKVEHENDFKFKITGQHRDKLVSSEVFSISSLPIDATLERTKPDNVRASSTNDLFICFNEKMKYARIKTIVKQESGTVVSPLFFLGMGKCYLVQFINIKKENLDLKIKKLKFLKDVTHVEKNQMLKGF